MKVSRKVMFILICVAIFLIGFGTSTLFQRYSEPTYQNGSDIIYENHPTPVKQDCPRDEWNDNFEDYRSGLISKEDMVEYVRSCR